MKRAGETNAIANTAAFTRQKAPGEKVRDRFYEGKADVLVSRSSGDAPVASRDGGQRLLFSSQDVPGEIFGLVIMPAALLSDLPGLDATLQRGWFRFNSHMADSEEEALQSVSATGFRPFRTKRMTRRFLSRGAFMANIERVWRFVGDADIGDVSGDLSLGGFGLQFADGTIIGDPSRIMLRFRLPE